MTTIDQSWEMDYIRTTSEICVHPACQLRFWSAFSYKHSEIIISRVVVYSIGVQTKSPTVKDVAQQAGVSVAAVSRVLNGSTAMDGELRRPGSDQRSI